MTLDWPIICRVVCYHVKPINSTLCHESLQCSPDHQLQGGFKGLLAGEGVQEKIMKGWDEKGGRGGHEMREGKVKGREGKFQLHIK